MSRVGRDDSQVVTVRGFEVVIRGGIYVFVDDGRVGGGAGVDGGGTGKVIRWRLGRALRRSLARKRERETHLKRNMTNRFRDLRFSL